MPLFKLGAPTVAECRVCGGSVFADEHVVRESGQVNHAQCVLYPPRKARRRSSGAATQTA
jgi:hypothetical protein